MAYSANVDYQAKIDDAVKRGDFKAAAGYEEQRNDKITSTGDTKHATTNNYSKYLSDNSGSGGGSNGSGSGNQYGDFNNSGTGSFQGSADDYDRILSLGQQFSKQHKETDDPIKQKELHDLAILNYGQLGMSYDDSSGEWSDGYDRPEERPSYDYEQEINGAYDDAEDAYKRAQEEAAAANQAKVDSAITDLNAQKGDVAKQTATNNAAAEQAYMQTVNSNGGLAENLARAGLLSTGLTESSQISAGNEYQNALNQNATTQTEAIGEIERAITKAQLEGDLSTAEALAGLLTQIAQLGIDRADKIAGWNQWQTQNAQNEAALTGKYNGKTTLAGQQAEDQHQAHLTDQDRAEIDNQILQINLDILLKYGYQQAEAEQKARELTNQGLVLDNQGKTQEYKYQDWYMRQQGVK